MLPCGSLKGMRMWRPEGNNFVMHDLGLGCTPRASYVTFPSLSNRATLKLLDSNRRCSKAPATQASLGGCRGEGRSMRY